MYVCQPSYITGQLQQWNSPLCLASVQAQPLPVCVEVGSAANLFFKDAWAGWSCSSTIRRLLILWLKLPRHHKAGSQQLATMWSGMQVVPHNRSIAFGLTRPVYSCPSVLAYSKLADSLQTPTRHTSSILPNFSQHVARAKSSSTNDAISNSRNSNLVASFKDGKGGWRHMLNT
jgi:hypothetical protein